MNQFAATPLCPPEAGGEGRNSRLPASVPANPFGALTPYEFFIAEKERCYQLLINAGIDEDKAAECASHVAMMKVAGMLNADNYEFSPNVYGSEQ